MFTLRIRTKDVKSSECKKKAILKCLQSVLVDIENGKIQGIIKSDSGQILGRFNLEE